MIAEYMILVFATSVGTFSREMIFPRENTFRQNVGWSILSGMVAFAITQSLKNSITIAFTFMLAFAMGFFLPVFKDWISGKKIFKIAIKILKGVKSAGESALDEIEKELSDED